MTGTALTGLPTVTTLLTTTVSPDDLLARVVTGPLSAFDATAGILMHGVDDTLVMAGSYGYAPGDLAGWETMPVTADLPICRAYREGEYVVTSTVVATNEYAGLAAEPDRWDDFYSRTPHGSIVSVPLISQGVAVGCLGFSCGRERAWGTDTIGLLDCLSSSLAMWMTHPISGLAAAHAWVPSVPVTLTPRQREVLRLVAAGQSTAAVAARLRYSESTVKQELQRATRMLETTDRAVAAQRARSLGLLSADSS